MVEYLGQEVAAVTDRRDEFISISPEDGREIDFTRGEFWQANFGKAVREFYETAELEGYWDNSIGTGRAASLLQLKGEGVGTAVFSALARSGFLAGVTRRGRWHVLNLGHVLVGGLVLLHRERHYPLGMIEKQLRQILEGSDLEMFLGRLERVEKVLKRDEFFDPKSPWRDFPLVQGPELVTGSAGDFRDDVEKVSTRQRVKPPDEDGRDTHPYYTIEAAEARADRQRGRPSLWERIPEIIREDLQKLVYLDAHKPSEIYSIIPDLPDEVNLLRLGLSFQAVQIIMFAPAVTSFLKGDAENYDPELKHLTNVELKAGVWETLKWMLSLSQRYRDSRLEKLPNLFIALSRAVEARAPKK